MIKPLLLLLASGLAAGAAHAGQMNVSVTDKDGKPTPDVVVLIDTASKVAPRPAAAPVVIAQESLKFAPFLTIVPVGSTLRFVNKDGYDHHVRSTPSGPLGSMPAVKSFELRLDAAEGAAPTVVDDYKVTPYRKKSGTTSVDVKVDQPGPIGLGCHIHSSMRGQVYVSATPFFAKTDANGIATIDGVPDGAIELNLWHPDQLQEQATQRLQMGAAPVNASAQLNFTPRRRRS
ncbi:plastocyanin [Piscinibacter sp. XHJ-5]|uniref:plastocyanin n=1 Tax=Piscinibacter sp. XHJ-5 TaxID=3037797 RepID=UPI0024536F08|nr:plastocyanin [Piscinibacter sp. XHJ-5]